MAVNINTVYTTVLYILNKEQRGYIPPAEFNSLAVQVQNDIFDTYFPDGNQVNRLNQSNRQNDTEFFDMFKDISYKLFPFEKETDFTWNGTNLGFIYTGNKTIYKLGEIIATTPASQTGQPSNIESVVQLTSKSDYTEITRSKLTKPTAEHPICFTTQTAAAIARCGNGLSGSSSVSLHVRRRECGLRPQNERTSKSRNHPCRWRNPGIGAVKWAGPSQTFAVIRWSAATGCLGTGPHLTPQNTPAG